MPIPRAAACAARSSLLAPASLTPAGGDAVRLLCPGVVPAGVGPRPVGPRVGHPRGAPAPPKARPYGDRAPARAKQLLARPRAPRILPGVTANKRTLGRKGSEVEFGGGVRVGEGRRGNRRGEGMVKDKEGSLKDPWREVKMAFAGAPPSPAGGPGGPPDPGPLLRDRWDLR